MEGKGSVKAGTGAFTLPVTFPARIGEPAGHTSPEELMAASHAACYAMALNATLGRKGGSAARTLITATVTADKSEAGIKLVSSKLKATAEGLSGKGHLTVVPTTATKLASAARPTRCFMTLP